MASELGKGLPACRIPSASLNTKILYISVSSQETLTRGEVTYSYSKFVPTQPATNEGCHLAAHWLKRTRKWIGIIQIFGYMVMCFDVLQ